MQKSLLAVTLIFSSFFIFSQNGPGGVGSSTSTTDSLMLWLRADSLVTVDGSNYVTSWGDISGNGNDYTTQDGAQFPFTAAGLNGQPTIDLTEVNTGIVGEIEGPTTASYFGLSSNDPIRSGDVIMVFQNGTTSGYISQFPANGSSSSFLTTVTQGGGADAADNGEPNDLQVFVRNDGADGDNFDEVSSEGTGANNFFVDNQFHIARFGFDIDGDSVWVFHNSTFAESVTVTDIGYDGNVGNDAHRLGSSGGGQDYDGQIAEFILFTDILNDAEYIVILNYLNARYALDILTADFYTGTGFLEEVIGIGNDGASDHMASTGNGGGLYLSGTVGTSATTFDEDEWLFAGHDGGATTNTFADVTDVGSTRVNRIWKIEKTEGATNAGFDATITFDLGELGLSDISDFVLYKRTATSGNFTDLGLTPSVVGDQVSFLVPDSDTDDAEQYFTLGYGANTPGGVGDDLRLWLQADRGVETTGSAIDDWRDQTPNSNDATDPSSLVELQSNLTNFNPGAVFDGDALSLQGSVTTTNSNLSFFTVYQDNSAANSGGAIFEFNSGQRHFLLDNSYAGVTMFGSNISKDVPALLAINHPFGTSADIYQDGSLFEGSYTTTGNSAAGTYNYTLGDDSDGGNTFSGTINEIIAYDATLSITERERVETYLAIKYGITLSHDYLRSDGTLVFDVDNSAVNDGYENQIVALGSDITSGLSQKVAKSANDSLVIALEEDYISANESRSTSLGDDSFFFVSNDAGDFGTTAVNGDFRLNRVWKVNESGTVGSVFVGIPTSLFEFGAMLVSTDETFTSGVTEVPVSIVGDYNSVNYDFTNGQYFTFTLSEVLDNPDLLVWLKADAGVTTSGSDVTNWADQSGNSNDADNVDTEFNTEPALAGFIQAEDPGSLATVSLNYNPSITFANDDRPLTGSFTSTEDGATFVIVGKNTDVASSFDAWFDTFRDGDANNSTNRTYFFEERYNEGPSFTNRTLDDTTAIYTIVNPTSTISDIYENGSVFESSYDVDNSLVADTYDYVLADDATGGNEMTGEIAEFMVFQGALSQAEVEGVETYLAIKYGLTLGHDYIAPDGSIVLDISADENFDTNVAAIARDESLELNQKVSRAEFDNLVLSLEQDFESSNALRTVQLSNEQYFVTASNTGSVASDSTYRGFSGNRLGRKWKVTETNNPGAVYVAISDTVAANFNVFLVSTDSTFESGVTEVPLQQSGGFYYVNRDFTTGEFFTFANSVSPGGVGDNLLVWLKADSDLTVDDWLDQSGGTNNATSPENDPVIDVDGINFNPTLDFTTSGNRMQGTVTTSTTDLSYLIVAEDRSVGPGGVLFELDDAIGLTLNDGSYAGLTFTSPATINKNADQLISTVHNGSTATVYLDGAVFETGAVNAAAATTYNYSIGDNVGSTNGFDGSISEVIIYDDLLVDSEREMLESYLAVKYALPIQHDVTASDGSVVLDATESAGYLNGLMGLAYDVRTQLDQKVATAASGSLLMATTDDFTTENTARATAFDDLQYSLVTNDGAALTITADYKAESNVRLERIWEVHELNNPGTVVLALPNSGDFTMLNSILVSSDPTFTTGVIEQSLTLSGGFLIVSIDLTDGQYFTFTTAEPESNIWYSYLSGNWSDPANWTLDGAISPLYLNPSNEIPSEGDTVVINSGRTITSDLNGLFIRRMEINGSIDLANTSGHDFTYILGSGTMVLAGASGVDNYPSGVDTLFYSATEGGTVQYDGTGLTLDTKRRYNNLVINLDGVSNEVEQTADSIWVFGGMTITQGKYQIGSNSVADNEVITVDGNLLVEGNGGIEVGTADARHELNLSGDFTNQGIAEFTNRTSADVFNEATDGIIDLNFVSATQNQLVDLQNTTNFYRMEIDKGVDDTYKVTLQADDPSFFNLFGFADDSHSATAQLTTNDNAVGLIFGTVEFGNNIQVNELCDGLFNVSEGASLIIDGGDVDGDEWIVTYGSVVMNSGTLDLGTGTVLRNSGFWEVNGGTVNMGHFRTSALGVGNDGSWTQTGGVVNITGSGSQSDYYSFSLTYEDCSFTMTGGALNIAPGNAAPDGLKGIFLNAAPENISVTGGTVNVDIAHTETDAVNITSAVPFYNLTLTQSVANANPGAIFFVSGGNSGGAAPDGVDLPSQTLQVLNDFTIDNAGGNTTTVDFDGNDVEVTGNLTIQSGAVTDFTEMTLKMNGSGSSDMDIQLATTLVLDSLEIDKADGVNVNITNGQATAIQVDNYFNLVSGNFNIDGFDVTANGNLNIADTVGTAISTGQFYLNGGAAQTITSNTGAFYDLEIDNANGVSLNGDLGVINDLILDAGVFDINTNKLSLNSEVSTGGAFSATLMIQTSGSSSDGGVEYYFDGLTADPAVLLFPLGANGKYTPASVDLAAVFDDGFVQINPVDSELSTTDLSGGSILDYHWRVRNADFSTLPNVSTLTFVADAADDPTGGPLTSYVPGAVEDGVDSNDTPTPDTDYNRFYEDANGISSLTIEFDGEFSDGSVQPFQLRTANYTAGLSTRFVGDVSIFYSNEDGSNADWDEGASWNSEAEIAADPIGGNVADEHDDDIDQIAGNTEGVDYPGPGDIAILGVDPDNGTPHSIRIERGINAQAAEFRFVENVPIVQAGRGGFSFRPELVINSDGGDPTISIDRIIGVGVITDRNNVDPDLSSVDIGGFTSEADSYLLLENFQNSFTYQNLPSLLPNLIVTSDGFGDNDRTTIIGTDVQTSGDLIVAGGVNLELNSSDPDDGDLVVGGNLEVINGFEIFPGVQLGDGGTAVPEVRFPGTSGGAVPSRTVEVLGDLNLTRTNAEVSVSNVGSSPVAHSLIVHGNILQDVVGGGLQLATAADEDYVQLTLASEGVHSFDITSGPSASLFNLAVNKGSDTTSTFSFNGSFSLLGQNTSAPQSLAIENGKLILNNPAINIELADNSDFSISSTAGLEVTQGAITSTGANIILGGLLRLNGGSATLASTDIQYSSAGSALIDISSGTLNVGGQVRRSLTSLNGVLKYRQTGGDVDIATDVADNNSRAAFEVLNSGSEFTLTGGTFNIARGVTGDANLSLELDPTTVDVSGSTITLFEGLGANYGANFFNVASAIDLNNLTIANSIDLPDVQLFNQSLVVNDLTINANQALLANTFNMTVNGNFDNEGTYTNTSTETIIAGSGAQAISGNGTFTIYDLRKSGSGTTTSSVELTVDHDLFLTGGTLDIGANALNVQNDATIQSTLTNTGGNGLVFDGNANQQLRGLANTAIDIGTITISNANGVDIPDGNGYDFNITQELRLNGGVFNIGGSLITMSPGAPVTEVSTFNVNNMVQTNSSFTDNGLKIDFFTVAADTTIFFPIGELKYTPVQFDLNAGTTAGGIRVRPANERHPTIADDAEDTMSEPEIDDTQNVLQYHWIVVAENLTNANGSASFFYDHDDVTVTAPYDTTNFISARLLANDVNWDKFPPTLFLGGEQRFDVPISIATSAEITGDYTAGVGSSDGTNADIEGAIPDQLAQYETNFVGVGNYSAAANWNTLNGPDVTDGVGPVGAQIIVRNGDDLTLDLDNIRLFSAEIESGGILRIPSGTTGVRLGNVSGSGTIVLEDNELLPTGEYTSFLACDGGGLQYSGTTSYNVLSGISQIREVIFDGSGTRIMPNNLLTVCDRLEINGPTVAFNSGLTYTIGDADTDALDIQAGTVTLTNGSVINVTGDLTMSGGSFTGTSGTSISVSDDVNFSGGTIDWNGTSMSLVGTTEQLVDGAFTGTAAFENLVINNSSATGVTINSGSVVVENLLTMTDGLINTTSTETLTLTSTGDWTGASSASYFTGPLIKEGISATSTYEFPVGKTARYAPASIVNVVTGGDTWTAEYFTSTGSFSNATFDNSDPGSGFNALIAVQGSDRWQIESAGDNEAQVRLTYGSHNSFTSVDNIRVVWWDDADTDRDVDGIEDRWENQGGIRVGSATTGTITSEAVVPFTVRQFAMGDAPQTLLPVELIEFNGTVENGVVSLSWRTASEVNNDRFEIEHSLNGFDFEVIGMVDGNGTTNEEQSYTYIDQEPAFGINYYRFRQVDFDGEFEYSPTIRLENDFVRRGIDVTIFPNPARQDNLNLKIDTGDDHTPTTIKIIDLSGNIYFREEFDVTFNYVGKVRPLRSMESGLYFLVIEQGNNIDKKKLIIR